MAVKGLSRSGDGAAFTGLLSVKTEFDLGSCFLPVFRMEEPSWYLGGMLLVLVAADVVLRLLRNGSETET